MKDLDTALFFNEHPEASPLYKTLEDRMLAGIRDVAIKVQKTQIAFANRHNFAFASFFPVRKAKERPKVYITVTFGRDHKKKSSSVTFSWLNGSYL